MATWITCEVEGCKSITQGSSDPYRGAPPGWSVIQRGTAGEGPRQPAHMVCDKHPEIDALLGAPESVEPKAPDWVQEAINGGASS